MHIALDSVSIVTKAKANCHLQISYGGQSKGTQRLDFGSFVGKASGEPQRQSSTCTVTQNENSRPINGWMGDDGFICSQNILICVGPAILVIGIAAILDFGNGNIMTEEVGCE